ncbi:branched-chain amino acid ABC transporter permease [Yinghuangia seranimata]|uniref:branched-chain amino acid ABC transporter permease n=1 Tax=Yinghuangia seranimata TaxID=408067 RepID=UPI00248B6E2F|nr:branched-chain amino acid ABC transporter permease [Yinghuangia seranimata]MDI2126254.1 branched-chain amino acid ABC transporter permease [Yinghuangia seranimata]
MSTITRPEADERDMVVMDLAKLRRVPWYRQPRWTRLFGMVLAAALLALATGPNASTDDIFFSVNESMTDGVRLPVCIALMVAFWAFFEFVPKAPVERAKATARANTVDMPAWQNTKKAFDKTPVKLGALAVVVVVLAVLPLFISTRWNQVLVGNVAVYVLLAIGLNVVVGWAGLLDLGFIAFFAIGAYSTAFWTGSLPTKPPVELNPFLAMPIAVVTCLIAGVLLGAPTLRLRGDYLAIVTLGFHEIVYLIANNANGFSGGSGGATNIPHPSVHLGFLDYEWELDPKPYWWLIMGMAAVVVFLFIRLEHSRVGRAWTAIREDEIAAAANGVNTVKYKLMAFAIGASTSGLAGGVYASKTGFISPESFKLMFSVLVLAYVIFGGMGSIWGVMVGTALLAWLPEYLKDWVDENDRITYLGALLVIMMIYRPQGLIPSRRRKRELTLAKEGIGDADAMTEPAGGRIA